VRPSHWTNNRAGATKFPGAARLFELARLTNGADSPAHKTTKAAEGPVSPESWLLGPLRRQFYGISRLPPGPQPQWPRTACLMLVRGGRCHRQHPSADRMPASGMPLASSPLGRDCVIRTAATMLTRIRAGRTSWRPIHVRDPTLKKRHHDK
jgi:hypothetical protein